MEKIESAPELYAHAIAIEREAAQRYSEFAERMADLGNDAVAEVFDRLAGFEAEHLETLLRRTEGVVLPESSAREYQWLDAAAPETAARELVFRLITPRQALAIALAAEKRAQAFFEGVFMSADDPALRGLAQEMAMEEQAHVIMVERLLERTPESSVDWDAIFNAREISKGAPDV
jgi:rubrerythrin